MAYMSVAVHGAKLKYYFSSLKTNAACLILRPADKDEPAAVYRAEYTPANSKHAEQNLLEQFKATPPSFTVAHVYLFSYYTPCKNCKNKLKTFYGTIPNAKWKLAFQRYYLGSYDIQYSSEQDAISGMNELYAKGWKVSRWEVEEQRFATDESDQYITTGRKVAKWTNNPDNPLVGSESKYELFSALNRGDSF